ncbi:MAG: serine/threonine protein kinase, partial [Planctomycetota bacterium]
MVERSETSPSAEGSDASWARFGFDDAGEAWLDHIREAEAPLPIGSLGPYELCQEVSRGGQGVVYRARQRGTNREIAVKRLLAGALATPSMRRRFEREAEVLASLNHPNVVTVFAMDIVDGVPLVAMEWLDGVPITTWAARQDATPARHRDIVRIFLKVCDAVHHAHQHGVIHRDLKPSNILIDAAGEPRVLDFGLAKLTATSGTADRSATVTDQFVGTLAYASPEQLCGRPEQLDVRSDVYSLGVILYEILTDRLPYTLGQGLTAAVQAIQHAEPARPSTIAMHLDRDLEAITLKALAKDKNDRYQSTDALADDLRRYLSGDPVTARVPSGLGQLLRTLRRHRATVAFVATVFALVTALAVVATILAGSRAEQRDLAVAAKQREAESRQSAQREAAKAQAISAFLQGMFGSVNPMDSGDREVTVREVLDAAGARIETELAGQPALEAAIRNVMGVTYISLGEYGAAEDHLRRALELYRSSHDDDHADVASVLNDLGDLMTRKGEYAEADQLLREALRMRRDLFGDEHADVAGSLNNLAELMRQEGEYAASEPLWREALAIRRRVLGDEDPLIATSLDNLAVCLHQQGAYQEAETLYREALALDRKLLGQEHSDVADVLCNLGLLLRTKRDYAAAEPMLRESLAIRRKVLGNDHPNVTVSLNSLACLLFDKGDYASAEQLFREVLAQRREQLGEEHPAVALILNNLAKTLAAMEDYEAAESLYRQALTALRAVLGQDHPTVATTMSNLASLLQA